VIGLDQGSYEIQFKPAGYISTDTVRNRITGTFTPDNYYEIETNNTMGQATELQLDAAYTGYFGEEQDDKEYYSFFAEQGKQYQIRFPDMAALDRTTAIKKLVDSRGQETSMRLLQTKDYFYYDFIPEQTGTYYIKIDNYTGATYGVVRYQVGVFGGYAAALPGDVNDDGIVDGRDVLRLMKYQLKYLRFFLSFFLFQRPPHPQRQLSHLKLKYQEFPEQNLHLFPEYRAVLICPL
jgi:hypothetical protein